MGTKDKTTRRLEEYNDVFTGDPDYEAFGLQQSHNKEITMLAALKEYRNDLNKKEEKKREKTSQVYSPNF